MSRDERIHGCWGCKEYPEEHPEPNFCGSIAMRGPVGKTGNGIQSIELTEEGTVDDTYTVQYTDGTEQEFVVPNGAKAAATAAETAKTSAAGSATASAASAAAAAQSAAAAADSEAAAETAKTNAKRESDFAKSYMENAAERASHAEEQAIYAESWAKGDTGFRAGEDTNNAKYWSAEAKAAAQAAEAAKDSAAGSATEAEAAKEAAAAAAGAVLHPQIIVTTEAGAVVTCVSGSTTVTATAAGGKAVIDLPQYGAWTVQATSGGMTSEAEAMVDTVKQYPVALLFRRVIGVVWDYNNPSTALARLTADNDPNGLVNTTITTEPVAAVGAGAGSSPFDSFAPWSGMEEYNISGNTVGPKRGEPGFTRTGADTMVYIPEFYFRIVDDGDNYKQYFYISADAREGFTKHPGSGKYVARYKTIEGSFSKSGAAPLVSITRAEARTGAQAKGSGWSLHDYAARCAIQMLYIFEFADWNSQEKIGRGNCDSTGAAIHSGGTDGMAYHTGRAEGIDGTTAVQYRHIENLWGNVSEWIDGVNFDMKTVYICTTPESYADDTADGYTEIGKKENGNGYISGLALRAAAPWAFYPIETGGSDTTWITDYANSAASGWYILQAGGAYSAGGAAGLFAFNAGLASKSTSAGETTGARLMFHPQGGEAA